MFQVAVKNMTNRLKMEYWMGKLQFFSWMPISVASLVPLIQPVCKYNLLVSSNNMEEEKADIFIQYSGKLYWRSLSYNSTS